MQPINLSNIFPRKIVKFPQDKFTGIDAIDTVLAKVTAPYLQYLLIASLVAVFMLVGPINRIQRIGAQAIFGTFLTVVTGVADSRGPYRQRIYDRFWRRAVKMWTDIHTLSDTNPLHRNTSRMRKFRGQHRSPLYQVADALKEIEMEKPETINSFTLAPWEKRVRTSADEAADRQIAIGSAVRIAVSSSARNELVRIGGAIQIQKSARAEPKVETFSYTLGARSEQNPYSGELAAMARALSSLPKLRFQNVVLLTRNKAAVLTLKKPREQSGQEHLRRIYKCVRELRRDGNVMEILWSPVTEENELLTLAKGRAKEATRQEASPQTQIPRVQSTILNNTV